MAEKILIVEDDSRIARFIELELKHEDMKWILHYDGRSGLDKATSGDVILSFGFNASSSQWY